MKETKGNIIKHNFLKTDLKNKIESEKKFKKL